MSRVNILTFLDRPVVLSSDFLYFYTNAHQSTDLS